MTVAEPGLGLLLGSAIRPEDILSAAREGERMGLDEIWLAEDYFYAAAFSSAAAVLAATSRVRVGIGVASALVRHPAVTAMEIATLERMFPGRLAPGLGFGLPMWVGQMGLSPGRPVRALAERLGIVRELLAGGTVTAEGEGYHLDKVALAYPPDRAPGVALGVSGPKMLRMAAEQADGLVLSVLAGPAYVRSVRELADSVRKGGGRTRITCFALTAVGGDRDAARAAARPAVAALLCRRPDGPMIVNSASRDVVRDLAPRGPEHLAAHLPDECLDEYVLAGDAAECAERARALGAAGADTVVMFPLAIGGAPLSMTGVGDLVSVMRAPRG